MDFKCQTMYAVFDCHVTSPGSQKFYFRLVEGKWNKRYYNYKSSFNHIRYSHQTTLSGYVWYLKVTPNLKRSVVRCVTPYSNISKKCLLCLYEKLIIITYPRQYELLNKRLELLCIYSRENKRLLKNFRVNEKG